MQDIPKSTFNASKYLTENKLTFDLDKHQSDNINIINSFNNLKHKNLIKVYPEDLFCDKINKLCFTHSDKEIFQHFAPWRAKFGIHMEFTPVISCQNVVDYHKDLFKKMS